MRTIVKFIHHWTVYKAGECAAFPEKVAKHLIDRGYARDVNSPKPDTRRGVQGDAARLRSMISAPNNKAVVPEQDLSKMLRLQLEEMAMKKGFLLKEVKAAQNKNVLIEMIKA